MIVYLLKNIYLIVTNPIYNLLSYVINKSYIINNINISSNDDHSKVNLKKISIFFGTRPNLSIDKAIFSLDSQEIFKEKCDFIYWKNCSLIHKFNLIDIIYNIIHRIKNFNIFLKKHKCVLDNFTILLSNVSLTKNMNKYRICCKKLSIQYYQMYFISVENLCIELNLNTLQYSVDIKFIKITLIDKIIHKNLIDTINNLFSNFQNKPSKFTGIYRINSLIFNLQLRNFIRITLLDIVMNNDYVNIRSIFCKVWKKDICWINDVNIRINEKIFPTIYSIRLRILNSTGHKIYQTLSLFRKYLQMKQNITENTKVKIYNHTQNKNIGNYNFIDDFITIKTDLILKIFNLEIVIEPEKYTLIFKNICYEKNNDQNYIIIQNWLLRCDNKCYIKKHKQDNEKFIIKYNSSNLEIYPYSMYINIDTKKYGKVFGSVISFIGNISKSLSHYTPNDKKYIFEKIHIQSFSSLTSYTKSKFSYDNLILEGNLSELINLYSFKEIPLTFKNIIILKPSNGSVILKVLIKKLVKSLSGNNLKNIIKNTPAKPLVTIYNIKHNAYYYGNKISNFANDKFYNN